ncbi:outer membrane cobalamin receptor protein [Belliella baltica DSM 15883]|uniref:Outer membrane cobalamin receptor protein n=1 Tax=Belliella baltica (strain DSM 15883 / CIP 108006 / LMG 21964 / BA134) TaxID=866536 RepID=I3Z2P2_BELBD|nr:outer membrane beta-barrel protein [Belliella baltica]AFL83510.1 outer membrane cobalamin receptor protein [Belliella baltica DSM 15883]
MKITIYRLFFLLIMMAATLEVSAQRTQQGRPDLKFKGKVIEGPSKQPLIGANVLVKTVTDSLLASTVTDIDGNFEVSRPWIPTVKVEIIFLGFEKFSKEMGRAEGLDLGIIALNEDSKLLGEVVIEGQVVVGEQKGDTTSFNAAAFKTRENGDAEDLIRKLPGVTIQNGQIQARGENVQKVLVDGREFFGNDPFLAMRNLPSDVIDRVEILDQRSDQARLTGFDDGNYARTINIVTRGDRRQGTFGRVYAGYGTDDRYSAGGSLNFFKGDRRISLVGLFNNVNQQNFSQEDLGGGGGGRPGGGGPRGGPANFGGGQANGIITTNSMGLNYSDKLGTKMNVTGSYFYSNSRNNLSSFTNREIILSETNRQFYEEDLINTVENGNHRANARIEYDINPKHALIITPSLNYTTSNAFTDRDALTMNGMLDPLSGTRSISDNNSSGYNLSNNLVYRYKFEKQGRTLSTTLNTSFNKRDSFAELLAANRDYIRNISDTINQETFGLTDGFNYRAQMQLTEPINEKSLLTLSYQVSNNKSSADQQTFSLVPEVGIMVLDTALSNVFDNKFVVQRPSVGYRYNFKNWNINANLDYQYAEQDNESLFPLERVFNRSFSNLLPGLNLNYRDMAKGKTFRLRYRTSTNEPSVNQLQNVINNGNPLNLSVGNPNLGQSFNHNIFVNLGKLNLEKSRTFFVFAFASLTENFIGTNTFVAQQDTLINGEVLLRPGGQLSRPENLRGQFNTRVFMTYGAPIKAIKSQFNMNSSASFNRTPGIINGQLNRNDNIDLSQGLTLTSNISKDFDFTLSTTGTYTIVNSSLQNNLNNNYYIQNSNIRLYYSPNNGKLFVSNVVNNALYRGLSAGLDQQVWLWNIEAGYRFLKDNKGEFKVTVFDLLGQNNSIARTVNDISITDTFTRVLTRYALFSFTYNIGSFKQPTREQGGNPMMRMMQGGGGRSW